MALEQKTLLNRIEVVDGAVQIRLEVCVMNGDIKLASRWHRTVVNDDVSVEAQLAEVNMHLAAMGEEPVTAEDIDDIRLFDELRKDLKAQKQTATRVLGKPLADAITKAEVIKAGAAKN